MVALIVGALGLLVALYAAWQARHANGTADRALAWQQERDRERQTSRVSVTVEHRIGTQPRYLINLDHTPPFPQQYEVVVRVHNGGEQTEYLRTLRLRSGPTQLDLGGYVSPRLQEGTTRQIDPRGEAAAIVPMTSVEVDPAAGFVIEAELTSGPVSSATERLDAALTASLKEHNRTARR